MTAYFIRRFLLIIPTFIGVTLVAFTITRLVPGGPLERTIMEMRMAGAQGGEAGGGASSVHDPTSEISEEALDQMREYFDLDKSVIEAYFNWLMKVAHLDLGESRYRREPVWDLVVQRLPVSISFGLTGFIAAYLISIPLGVFKALRHGSRFDFGSSALVFIGYSIPGWALGALLLVFFASGWIHDLVISVPAGAGFGLPTAYFLLQAVGVLIERSKLGRRVGLNHGAAGWVFMFLFTAGPAYWLFHEPFIHNVINPFLKTIGAL